MLTLFALFAGILHEALTGRQQFPAQFKKAEPKWSNAAALRRVQRPAPLAFFSILASPLPYY